MLRRMAMMALAAMAPACMFADFSYEQSSKITGGMMAGMMKLAGAFSKQAREPITSTVAVKGDRMVHGSARQAQVVDLGKETITTIHFDRKTFSVMTFAEMKQMLEEVSQKMAASKDSGKADVSFKASVKDTGQKRQVAGFDAHEMLLSLEMTGTDQKTGDKGAFTMISDMWIAPQVSGYGEIREFHRRMAQKLNWTPGAMPMMGGRPDMAKGMAELYKEAAKLDGMPVLQVVKMGGRAEGMPQDGADSGAPPTRSDQPQAERPSVGGALGGALGGRFGLGGAGRRKKNQEQTDTAGAEQSAAGTAAGSGDASATLMEMTIEMSGFSSAPVDSSKFEVPAGFQRVEPDALERRRR